MTRRDNPIIVSSFFRSPVLGRSLVALSLCLLTFLSGCGQESTQTDKQPKQTTATSDASENASADDSSSETGNSNVDQPATDPDASSQSDLTDAIAEAKRAFDESPTVSIPLIGQRTWQEMDNPHEDGWKTEVLAEEANKQLKVLAKLLTHPTEINDSSSDALISDGFSCQPLYPASPDVAHQDSVFRVVRLKTDNQSQGDPTASAESDPHHGAAGLTAALKQLAAPFADAEPESFITKFKIFRIHNTDDGFRTRQYFSISAAGPEGMIEAHATWFIDWSKPSEYSKLRIRRIVVEQFELTETKSPDGKLLADCTESVLRKTDAYQDQLRRGLNHWIERAQQRRHTYLLGTPGIAIGDVNGDGLDDLYVCQEEGMPNRLFLQQPDGTAIEASRAWGVDWINDSRGVLLFDWDNDGDQDLAVAVLGGVALASNDNQQRFRFETMLTTHEDTMSMAVADVEKDGDLDLYVCTYSPSLSGPAASAVPGAAANFVYHDANDGPPNAFFLNDGKGNFTDATVESGFDVNNRRYGMAVAWEDYDNDGDQDLYVANDYGRDNLYQNDGKGHFVDVGPEANVEDSASGMSIAWGDYDRNGQMDAYVSNMFSSAGGRITFQDSFRSTASTEVIQRLRRFTRGNTLLKNLGDKTFKDVSQPARVELGRWAWSSLFADLNNDGWEDLLVANGYLTMDDNGDL